MFLYLKIKYASGFCLDKFNISCINDRCEFQLIVREVLATNQSNSVKKPKHVIIFLKLPLDKITFLNSLLFSLNKKLSTLG